MHRKKAKAGDLRPGTPIFSRQLVHSVATKKTYAKPARMARSDKTDNNSRSSAGLRTPGLTLDDFPLLAAPAIPTSFPTTPPHPHSKSTAPPTPSPAPLATPAARSPARDTNHAPHTPTPTHPAGAPAHSTTDTCPATPDPLHTPAVSMPAGSSQPTVTTAVQPCAARHDQTENPPEHPAQPDAPATAQAGERVRAARYGS